MVETEPVLGVAFGLDFDKPLVVGTETRTGQGFRVFAVTGEIQKGATMMPLGFGAGPTVARPCYVELIIFGPGPDRIQ